MGKRIITIDNKRGQEWSQPVRVLITGGSGFVASNIVQRFAASGHDVVSADITPPDDVMLSTLGDLSQRIEFATGDLRDADFVAKLDHNGPFERIVHAAVVTAVDPVFEAQEIARTVDINVMTTVRLLELARNTPDFQRFIYVSSSGLYVAPPNQLDPIHETQAPHLGATYAITKFTSEQMTRRYGELFGFEAAAVRIGGPFGPMDHKTWARVHRNVVCDIVDHALRGEPIIATQAGLDFARDWTYVGEIARGIEALTTTPTLRHSLYNLSSGQNRSIQEIVDITAEYLPGTQLQVCDDLADANINLITAQPRGPLSIERIQADTGFTPEVDLREGIRRFIDWWRTYQTDHRRP